jgi:PAS domain S-box-containing protein
MKTARLFEARQKREMPAWATESELYEVQIRKSVQYAMFAMDLNGDLLTWNAGVESLLGYSEEEWIGDNVARIFTPTDQAFEICASEMKLAAESGFSSDYRWHVRKDGSELFANGYMTAIRSTDGKLVGYSKILSDETRNKVLQDALTESNMALEQFAHVVSHDLQEPLRTIGTYSELIVRKQKDNLDEESQGFLKAIVGGVKRMNVLIQDILTFARVQTETDRPASYSLDTDFETALTHLEGLIADTNAIISHDPLPTVQCDQGQMVRLFQNLIGNALKYAKPNVAPVIRVSAKEEGLMWVISVQDNGIGFDQKDAELVFLPFKRLHSHDEYSGSGVGLPICKRIIEGHGGRIWAKSKLGEGTTIEFSLPKEGKAPPKHTKPVTAGFNPGAQS